MKQQLHSDIRYA